MSPPRLVAPNANGRVESSGVERAGGGPHVATVPGSGGVFVFPASLTPDKLGKLRSSGQRQELQ